MSATAEVRAAYDAVEAFHAELRGRLRGSGEDMGAADCSALSGLEEGLARVPARTIADLALKVWVWTGAGGRNLGASKSMDGPMWDELRGLVAGVAAGAEEARLTWRARDDALDQVRRGGRLLQAMWMALGDDGLGDPGSPDALRALTDQIDTCMRAAERHLLQRPEAAR